MITVFRGSGRRTECLFEECKADPFCAANFFESSGGPHFSFYHLGEQCQPDADHFAFLGQPRYGEIQEIPLIFVCITAEFGKFAEGPPKRCQHLTGVIHVKQID